MADVDSTAPNLSPGLGWADFFVAACVLALAYAAYTKVASLGPTILDRKGKGKTAAGAKSKAVNGTGAANGTVDGNGSEKGRRGPGGSVGGVDEQTREREMEKERESESPAAAFARPITPLRDFDWKTVARGKYRPFKPIYHITMALRNTTPSELITIDCDYLDRINLRRRIIAEKGEGVHGVVPDTLGAAAVREAYAYLMRRNLPERFPTVFSLRNENGNGKSTLVNSITGKSFPTAIGDPSDAAAEAGLRVLAETVEEDMFLLEQQPDGTHRCVAFVCCFPSGFDPREKLGLGLGAIHGPVPHYDKIALSMERFFGKMETGKPVCRLNWSVQTHGDLHNLASNHIKGDDDDDVAIDTNVDISKTHLRVEFQTLTRLPETRALLFSFKTYMYALAEVKAEGRGPELADAIEGLRKGNAPGMWRYKAAVRWGDKACEYLRS